MFQGRLTLLIPGYRWYCQSCSNTPSQSLHREAKLANSCPFRNRRPTTRHAILLHNSLIGIAQNLCNRCARILIALLRRMPHESLGEKRGIDALACPSSHAIRQSENSPLGKTSAPFERPFDRRDLQHLPTSGFSISISSTRSQIYSPLAAQRKSLRPLPIAFDPVSHLPTAWPAPHRSALSHPPYLSS